jgi:hypothetical protein
MKNSVALFVLALFVSVAASFTASAQPPPQPPLTDFKKLKDGDIVFIESNSERAPVIKALTGSSLTHCGIVFQDKPNHWIVYEGAGRPVGEYSDLDSWIGRESGKGKKNPIYVRRLKDREARLSSKLGALQTRAKQLHDTSYDSGFAWANKDSGGKEYIYCSELVWKAFNDAVQVALNKPHPLEGYILKTPDDKARTPDDQKDVKAAFEYYLNSSDAKDHRNGQPYQSSELAISPAEVFKSTESEAVTDTSQ